MRDIDYLTFRHNYTESCVSRSDAPWRSFCSRFRNRWKPLVTNQIRIINICVILKISARPAQLAAQWLRTGQNSTFRFVRITLSCSRDPGVLHPATPAGHLTSLLEVLGAPEVSVCGNAGQPMTFPEPVRDALATTSCWPCREARHSLVPRHLKLTATIEERISAPDLVRLWRIPLTGPPPPK